VRVIFDTTVLCGAFTNPAGANYRLLELADDGVIDGFVTDVVGYEFVLNAMQGKLSRGQPVDDAYVAEFLDGFPNIFDPAHAPRVSIGKDITTLFLTHGKPVGQVLHALTGRTRDDLLIALEQQQIVAVEDFDPGDLHVLVAAVEQNADVVCTSNTSDFKQASYGRIRVMKPGELLAWLETP
jgi:predicted nucleic acid-binding protein